MHNGQDISYFRRRSVEEQARAERSAEPCVASVHRELAALYDLRAGEALHRTFAVAAPTVGGRIVA